MYMPMGVHPPKQAGVYRDSPLTQLEQVPAVSPVLGGPLEERRAAKRLDGDGFNEIVLHNKRSNRFKRLGYMREVSVKLCSHTFGTSCNTKGIGGLGEASVNDDR